MTVIAFDGKTLAADKRSTFGGTPLTTTKIVRCDDGVLIGAAGNSGKCREAIDWYRSGADPEKYKGFTEAQLLVIDTEGVAWMYDESAFPIRLDDAFCAIGSGMGEALVAMACGKSAREAVELASRYNTSCGNGVDSLELRV